MQLLRELHQNCFHQTHFFPAQNAPNVVGGRLHSNLSRGLERGGNTGREEKTRMKRKDGREGKTEKER